MGLRFIFTPPEPRLQPGTGGNLPREQASRQFNHPCYLLRQREGGGGRGVVVDGRDIGTVVFPEAPLKIFLTATPDERARRRLSQRGQAVDGDLMRRESQELAARDTADSTRTIAPLKPAPDAVLLDTTTLTLEQQVIGVVELARGLFPG